MIGIKSCNQKNNTMNKNMKLFIWSSSIDSMLRNENIGGLAIQLHHWAKTFISKGWVVYSLSTKEKRVFDGIRFLKQPHIRYIGIFIELLYSFYYILRYRPNIIMLRGAGRQLSYVCLFAKTVSAKVVFMGASDTDFIIGSELINSERDRKLYRFGVRKTDHFIVQNERQKEFLTKNYGQKNCIIIPNIWPEAKLDDNNKEIDFLWVSNFRELKRPSWFIELAKEYPTYKFTMIGGAYTQETYEQCKKISETIPNLSFLGPKSLDEVNVYFTKSRVFVCTSEIEGFPNTFLQAWSNNIPVISTFDPSDIIKNNNLGIACGNIEELCSAVNSIMCDSVLYCNIKNNIKDYFYVSHNPETRYYQLLNALKHTNENTADNI